MCPCISSKDPHAICAHSASIPVCPSVFERENYCFSLYELCPVFSKGSEFVGKEVRQCLVMN